MSQEIWPPIADENIRVMLPVPEFGPMEPASVPLIRPKPLYPKVSSRKELVWLPPM